MIVNKCLQNKLLQKCLKTVKTTQKANIYNRSCIGNRDWVGFGKTGNASYLDDPSFPFPAVRFKENNNELFALREKEKGDWRKLSVEEKKSLYRASFQQTLEECIAPTGQWKSTVGLTLFLLGIGLWSFIVIKLFAYGPKPKTFSEEHRRAALRRCLDLKMGHLTGVSSKWDYEKDDWK